MSTSRQIQLKNKLYSSYSHATNETVVGRRLQDNHAKVRQGDSVNRSQIICKKFKPEYYESAKGSSDSRKLNGEHTMNEYYDAKLEAMNTKIDSNEKVMDAIIAGQKSYMDGKFEAVIGEIKASRAESQGQFQAIQGQFQAVLDKIEASGNRTRLWVVLTGIAIVAGSVGFVAASIVIWKTLSGS